MNDDYMKIQSVKALENAKDNIVFVMNKACLNIDVLIALCGAYVEIDNELLDRYLSNEDEI